MSAIEELKSRIASLEQEAEILVSQAYQKRSQALALKMDLVSKAYGVVIGSVVIYKGEKYRATDIDPRWGKPWIKGNPKKKDGTWGTAERNLYDRWEVAP